MRALLVGTLAALALSGCTTASAPPADAAAPLSQEARIAALVEAAGFEGEIAISADELLPQYHLRTDGERGTIWPWASVTKQIVATLVMQEVEAGRLDLDRPVAAYLDGWPDGEPAAPTLRQLLRHQSGLVNPETREDFVQVGATPIDPTICLDGRTAPGGAFAYNNCDTLWVGRVLEAVTGKSVGALFAERMAGPLTMRGAGFPATTTPIAPSDEGAGTRVIASYGAAGGLVGTAQDLLKFDIALMEGRFLSDTARAEMWRGDPQLGDAALGQWAFTATIPGCDGPVRIIERRGAIPGYQARNFILPDHDFALVAFTPRSEGDFAFGEIWSGEGFSHDLLAATACAR